MPVPTFLPAGCPGRAASSAEILATWLPRRLQHILCAEQLGAPPCPCQRFRVAGSSASTVQAGGDVCCGYVWPSATTTSPSCKNTEELPRCSIGRSSVPEGCTTGARSQPPCSQEIRVVHIVRGDAGGVNAPLLFGDIKSPCVQVVVRFSVVRSARPADLFHPSPRCQ